MEYIQHSVIQWKKKQRAWKYYFLKLHTKYLNTISDSTRFQIFEQAIINHGAIVKNLSILAYLGLILTIIRSKIVIPTYMRNLHQKKSLQPHWGFHQKCYLMCNCIIISFFTFLFVIMIIFYKFLVYNSIAYYTKHYKHIKHAYTKNYRVTLDAAGQATYKN